MDSLRVLDTDPVDYLVTPRVLASMIAGPILNVLCLAMGARVRGPHGVGSTCLHLVKACAWALQAVCRAACQLPANSCCLSHGAGLGASIFLADMVYGVPANVILDSARRTLTPFDIITSSIKSWVFGSIISIVSVWLHHGCYVLMPV
jgi:ABC-type transporter Mla maintaining outer membrane lipid asymmetry permease subunit MlaE